VPRTSVVEEKQSKLKRMLENYEVRDGSEVPEHLRSGNEVHAMFSKLSKVMVDQGKFKCINCEHLFRQYLFTGMPQQAAQVLDSLIGFCEQDVEPITLPGGNIAASAPCARFPSTGYSNLASSVGATRAQIQEVMKEMDKVSTIASLVLVKYMVDSTNLYVTKIILTCTAG